jgi:hypothetical protein
MDDGPQNGLISAPGNDHGDYGTQSDTGTHIHGNCISIVRAAITGGQQQQWDKKEMI